MAKFELELPLIQNWSCHNCGGCCKQHVIEITDAEKKCIEAQGWDADDELKNTTVIESSGKTHRLGHQPDGSCVFLNEDGLCRIHAKYGEPAKPLACRIYPYAFHPAGDDIAVSLRFSCPSVVENKGRPVDTQQAAIRELARDVVPRDFRAIDPPPVKGGEQLQWDDLLQIVYMFDAVFAENAPTLVSVLRSLLIADTLEEAKLGNLTPGQLTELLQLIAQDALAAIESVPSNLQRPKSVSRRHMRMLVAQYTRHDTMADAAKGFRGYWQRFKTSISFTRGKGAIPAVRPEFSKATFEQINQPFSVTEQDTIDEIMRRYFRVKLQGIHFCGAAYYHAPLVEGLRSLMLVWPSVMWLARWRAAGENRTEICSQDVITALTIVDHNHGYSEVLGLRSSRLRVSLLARMGQLQPLCLWYSRTPNGAA